MNSKNLLPYAYGILLMLMIWSSRDSFSAAHKNQPCQTTFANPLEKIIHAGKGSHAIVRDITDYTNSSGNQEDLYVKKNSNGMTPLHLATERSDMVVANHLIFITPKKIVATHGNKTDVGFVLSNSENNTSSIPADIFCSKINPTKKHTATSKSDYMLDQYGDWQPFLAREPHYSLEYGFWFLVLKRIFGQACHKRCLDLYTHHSTIFNLKKSLTGIRNIEGKTWPDVLIEKMTRSITAVDSKNEEMVAARDEQIKKCKNILKKYLQQQYGAQLLHKKTLNFTPLTKEDLHHKSANRCCGYHLHTPLHNACMLGNKQAIAMLKNSAAKNCRNKQGHTPLETAIVADREDSLWCLLYNGYYSADDIVSLQKFAKTWGKKRCGQFLYTYQAIARGMSSKITPELFAMVLDYRY